jgi:hypothetical protein
MLQALVAEVNKLSGKIHPASFPADLVAFTRKKVEPMVRGLFRRDEQETVLAVLEKSLVFLTVANIEQGLLGCTWPHSAWDPANLYLGSMDAPLLGPDVPKIVGLSEETTCLVSLKYFKTKDPFADFVVHEAAHIFHNCKRRTRTGNLSSRPLREEGPLNAWPSYELNPQTVVREVAFLAILGARGNANPSLHLQGPQHLPEGGARRLD